MATQESPMDSCSVVYKHGVIHELWIACNDNPTGKRGEILELQLAALSSIFPQWLSPLGAARSKTCGFFQIVPQANYPMTSDCARYWTLRWVFQISILRKSSNSSNSRPMCLAQCDPFVVSFGTLLWAVPSITNDSTQSFSPMTLREEAYKLRPLYLAKLVYN